MFVSINAKVNRQQKCKVVFNCSFEISGRFVFRFISEKLDSLCRNQGIILLVTLAVYIASCSEKGKMLS